MAGESGGSATQGEAGFRVGIVGGGPWGLALAAASARNTETVLVSRRSFDTTPKGVRIERDYAALRDTRLVILAVPSSVAADAAKQIGDHLDGSHYVVHGVRGLVGPELATISELVRDFTPSRRVGALGGPVMAQDLLEGQTSVLVCGSKFPEVNKAVKRAFSSESLRVYSTPDLHGLEWASALVGCLAIVIGFAEGKGLSPALVAALICRSMGEAARIAGHAGGDERTLLGLAGYGDLLASIEQEGRPEVALGRAMAKGTSVPEARAQAKERIEAIDLIPRIVTWAEANRVRTPIFHALAAGIAGTRSTSQILQELMTAPMEEGA
ncbi:MAG: glycerol-3-phosphate dehydrogenase [Polyangiaceae bacterium]